ncbi:hypothetical protein V491_07410 [Pseudogymnoascus sp. VKM F-3775]|nr:hypothetical protein V491_07410 [Pseudogymnoascus sp. VKM F-3775]
MVKPVKPGLLTYRCVIDTPDNRSIGSLSGKSSDVNIHAICYYDDELRARLTFNVSVSCPEHMKKNQNQFHLDVNLHNINVKKLNTELIKEGVLVSDSMRDTPEFKDVLGYKHGVIKTTLELTHCGITSSNLFNLLKFENYEFEQKPWINQAMDDLRKVFSTDGILTFYVRNEMADFRVAAEELIYQFNDEDAQGTVIRHFYKEKYHKSTAPRPAFSLNELNPDGLPAVRTKPVNSHIDLLDIVTRQGLGYVQMSDATKAQVDTFNGQIHYVKLLDSPGSGNMYCLAQLHLSDDDEGRKDLRLGAGDIIHFQFNTKPNPIEPTWRGVVLKNPIWMETGHVALRITRPHISEYSCMIEGINAESRPRVITSLPCGDGSGEESELYEKMQEAPLVPVRCRLEFSDIPKKRVVNAYNILSRQTKQRNTISYSNQLLWIANEHLKKLGKRLLNQTAIPDSSFNLIGQAERLLSNFNEEDHRTVINYLKKIPVNDGLALAVIEGRAGSGKTTFMSIIIAALLACDASLPAEKQFLKFLVVTPSNEPTDVFIEKILAQVKNHSSLQGEIFIRGHNVDTESSYVDAFMVDTGKKAAAKATATTLSSGLSTSPSSASPSSATSAIPSPTPRPNMSLEEIQKKIDTEFEALKSILKAKDFASINKLVDNGEINQDKGQAKLVIDGRILRHYPLMAIAHIKELFELVNIKENLTGTTNSDSTQQAHSQPTGESLTDIIVDESLLLDDGTINMDIADVLKAKVMAEQINATMTRGASLVSDPRFQKVKQSIGFTVLSICGLAEPANNYTDTERWSSLNILLTRLMKDGDDFPITEKMLLKQQMTDMRDYIFSVAKVVATTPMTACTAPYYNSFHPTVLVADEMNKCLLPEFVSVWIHYEAPTAILMGDTKQLSPVIPVKHHGFIPELTRSALHYFSANYYPQAEIYTQRRARKGIADIPTMRYYRDYAANGLLAESDTAHPCTAQTLSVLKDLVPPQTDKQTTSPAVYLEIHGTISIKDGVTGSVYNLKSAALTVNIIERCVSSGMSPKSFGVITPYLAQINVFEYAFKQLDKQFPGAGYKSILVGTTDSMEGNEAQVVIFDSGITHNLGFTNDRGRCLVNLTRAKDVSIVIAQPSTLQDRRHVDTEIKELYKLAQRDGIVRQLGQDNELYQHRCVAAVQSAGSKAR